MSNTSPSTRQLARGHRDVGIRRHRLPAAGGNGVIGTHPIMGITRVALRFLSPGVVVLADVPYVEGEGRKFRPVIVVRVEGDRVVGIACTSSRRANEPTDIPLNEAAAAGLNRPTKARTGRAVQLDRTSVVQVMGHLGSEDARTVLGCQDVA